MSNDLHRELRQLRMDSAILRAGGEFLQRDTLQRFGFIHEHHQTWPVAAMCRVLNVSPSGYYAWRTRPPSQRTLRRGRLRQQISEIFVESRCTYGSPRVHSELVARGIQCCQKSVAKIMRQERLQAAISRKFQRTADSIHALLISENLLNREFSPARPNQVWVNDILAIPTSAGWVYLVALLDLFSRRVVGWSLGNQRTCELVSSALQMALTARQPPPGLLHHSDRGSQYASRDFQNLLARHQIVCSMSRKGNCWDNAVMESFFGTLKQELLQHHHFATREEARTTVVDYIENFYNTHRRHSTLNYLAPAEYEARYAASLNAN